MVAEDQALPCEELSNLTIDCATCSSEPEVKRDTRDSLPVCEVPIKAEFLLKDVKENISISEISNAENMESDEKVNSKKGNRRGQNKNRRKEMAQMTTKVRASSNRLCPSAYMKNVKCRHGDKCTSEHDISVFLSKKADDLGENCPVFDERGYCPFSYSCRFGKAHLSADLQQATKETEKPYQQTMNAKNMHIQVAMRKHTYDLKKSETFLNSLGDDYRNRQIQFRSRGNVKRRGGNKSRNKEREQQNAESESSDLKATSEDTGCEIKEEVASEETSVEEIGDAETSELPTSDEKFPNKIGSMERERKPLDMKSLSGKKYVAPLTTVGNLPFRRICVDLGADITCGEMALSTSILAGIPSEYSLVKRHPSEKIFGVQIAGGFVDTMTICSQIIADEFEVDFIDINMGCPIDVVNQKGGGCSLPTRPTKLYDVMRGMRSVMGEVPLTIKIRTGLKEGVLTAHETIKKLIDNGCRPDLITLHPRSKEQRYCKLANWDFTTPCAEAADETPLWACGDVLSWQQYYDRLDSHPISGIMMARGALIKPWLMTEIDERRNWDITATERFDLMKNFVWYGLDHWGSDDCGVEKTRRFLLEWLSFTCRYVPIGLLEVLPQHINHRPPLYKGRNELETLLASQHASDWVKISEMLLGKCPDGFEFIPKHKARSY